MTDAPEIVDGTVVHDEPDAIIEGIGRTGVSLERRPPATREVLMPLDVDQVVAGMEAYQTMLPRLLTASDYQAAGFDKDGNPRRFVKKSGWRKIARAFNLSTEIVSVHVERDADGNPTRSEAVVRAVAPNGLVSDGDGYCDVGEERFRSAKSRQKLENDLRTTATTRAKNRAISDMVGMGEVSAEEVAGGAVDDSPPAHPWGEQADSAMCEKTLRALGLLLDNQPAADLVFRKMVADSSPDPDRQFFPKAAARAILLTAVTLKEQVANPSATLADAIESSRCDGSTECRAELHLDGCFGAMS